MSVGRNLCNRRRSVRSRDRDSVNDRSPSFTTLSFGTRKGETTYQGRKHVESTNPYPLLPSSDPSPSSPCSGGYFYVPFGRFRSSLSNVFFSYYTYLNPCFPFIPSPSPFGVFDLPFLSPSPLRVLSFIWSFSASPPEEVHTGCGV